VLLSEAFNKIKPQERDSVTEEMLVLSCERCGRSFAARTLAVSSEPAWSAIYTCREDGAVLARVGVEGDFAFEDGSLVIRVAGGDVDWWDFLDPDPN
jgi:hypothetical protein